MDTDQVVVIVLVSDALRYIAHLCFCCDVFTSYQPQIKYHVDMFSICSMVTVAILFQLLIFSFVDF